MVQLLSVCPHCGAHSSVGRLDELFERKRLQYTDLAAVAKGHEWKSVSEVRK